MSTTRQQVKASIIACIADAQAWGLGDGVHAARLAFPGTPESVLWECWAELDGDQVEAWWQSVERTIDGEIIRNAVAAAETKGGAA